MTRRSRLLLVFALAARARLAGPRTRSRQAPCIGPPGEWRLENLSPEGTQP